MSRLSTALLHKRARKLSSLNNHGFVGVLVIALVAVGLVLGGYYYISISQTPTIEDEHASVELPSDAIQISGCIPFEGEHWGRLEDIPHGPFYVMNKGKVVAIEYMFTPDEIPGEEYAKLSPQEIGQIMQSKELSFADLVHDITHFSFDLPDTKFTHFDIHWTAPHPGIDQPHFDVHFYLVEDEELDSICPDSTIENIYTADMIQNLVELGVPGVPTFPEAQ